MAAATQNENKNSEEQNVPELDTKQKAALVIVSLGADYRAG